MELEQIQNSVIEGLRTRSQKSRKIAAALILLILLLGGGVAFVFAALSVPNIIFIGEQSNLSNAWINLNAENPNDLIQQLSKAVIRIGAVILAVYIIQILVSVTRYHLRIGDSLDIRADCLLLANGDPEILAKYSSILSVDHIGFEKIPDLPSKYMLNAVSNVAKSNKS